MAVHPLVGRALDVRRRVRGPDGRLYVDVQHPDGGGLRLPIEWTDLVIASSEDRSPAKATAGALATLHARLATLSSEGVDRSGASGSSSVTEHAISRSRAASSTPSQSADALHDGSSRGGVGSARASGPDGGGGET